MWFLLFRGIVRNSRVTRNAFTIKHRDLVVPIVDDGCVFEGGNVTTSWYAAGVLANRVTLWNSPTSVNISPDFLSPDKEKCLQCFLIRKSSHLKLYDENQRIESVGIVWIQAVPNSTPSCSTFPASTFQLTQVISSYKSHGRWILALNTIQFHCDSKKHNLLHIFSIKSILSCKCIPRTFQEPSDSINYVPTFLQLSCPGVHWSAHLWAMVASSASHTRLGMDLAPYWGPGEPRVSAPEATRWRRVLCLLTTSARSFWFRPLPRSPPCKHRCETDCFTTEVWSLRILQSSRASLLETSMVQRF